MDREVWRAAVQGITKSQTRLRDWTELNWTKGHAVIVLSTNVTQIYFFFPKLSTWYAIRFICFCSYLILVFKIPLSLFFEYVKHSGSFNYWKRNTSNKFYSHHHFLHSTYSYTPEGTVLNNFWLIHLYFKK